MATYKILHYSPRGSLVGTYTPDSAYTPAFSLRLNPHGDCRNGVLNQYARLTGVRAGDVLEVHLDDGSGLQPRYSGEVRIGASRNYRRTADLNLAGLTARLGKVEVRGYRIPEVGTLDPGAIARTAVDACREQLGSVLSSDTSEMPDAGVEGTALQPYYTPLATALAGLADRIPGGVSGVDALRRPFVRARSTGAMLVDGTGPGVKLEPRMVSAESMCTAVRWQLGIGADGHPITHLSRAADLIQYFGEHVYQAQVEDGVLYLKKLDASYEVRTATAQTYTGGNPAPGADWTVLTDSDPATRLMLTAQSSSAGAAPVLTAYAPAGRQIDVLRIIATANTPRVSNYNDYDAIGATATGETGLNGLYSPWASIGAGWLTTGGLPAADSGGNRLARLDVATFEAYEIDRAALDRMAERYYRVPSPNPVAVQVHGQWLAPQPTVRVKLPGEPDMVAKVAEVEYVSRRGWWGTIIHVEQRGDGVAEAQAAAIAERDRVATAGAARSTAALDRVAVRGDR